MNKTSNESLYKSDIQDEITKPKNIGKHSYMFYYIGFIIWSTEFICYLRWREMK